MQHLKPYLAAMPDQKAAFDLARLIEQLYRTQNLVSPNLRIQGGSAAATWQSQATVVYELNGATYSKAAVSSQAVPSAITWAAVASVFSAGGFLITLDASGNVATIPTNVSSGASAAAALQGLQWPAVPAGQVVIGAVIIATTAANTAFTAGTTNLDATNIGATFVNITGPFYPTAFM